MFHYIVQKVMHYAIESLVDLSKFTIVFIIQCVQEDSNLYSQKINPLKYSLRENMEEYGMASIR